MEKFNLRIREANKRAKSVRVSTNHTLPRKSTTETHDLNTLAKCFFKVKLRKR